MGVKIILYKICEFKNLKVFKILLLKENATYFLLNL